MPISDTLTKRMAAEEQAAAPDPLASAPIDLKVRNQMLHAIWGALNSMDVEEWRIALVILRHNWDAERGEYDDMVERYTPANLRSYTARDFIAAELDDARDFIELSCVLLNRRIREFLVRRGKKQRSVDIALEEINSRFREARLAYRFEPQLNQLVNIGTEQTHEAIVRPALNLLSQAGFEAALAEFRTAFDHISEGSWKDAVTAAGRAFEATMKAICTERDWPFDAKANAESLVTICLTQRLLPDWLSGSSQAFVAMMKAGVPHVRNNAGAHGSHPDADAVTETLARYAVNQAAASILLLLERHRDLPRTI